MLELRGLSKRLGAFALEDVGLRVEPGRCHVILGPTGCGKTTLLELALGLEPVDRGEVLLDGQPITTRPPGRRGISYLPQDLALFPHLDVIENIRYPLRVRDLGGPEREALVQELIDAVGIRPLLKRATTHLSGGEQQRVALVRALASGDRYLVLDEPLAALHEGLKRELWLLLKDLQDRLSLGILMVTHDLEEAYFLGDDISILVEGRVVQSGTKEDVYRRPRSISVARFLGVQNIFPATVVEAGDPARLRCDVLNADIAISEVRAREGEQVWIAIRAEHIRVGVRDGTPRENRIRARLAKKVLYGSRIALFVEPEAAGGVICLDVPLRKEASLAIGGPLDVQLPSEDIFCLREG